MTEKVSEQFLSRCSPTGAWLEFFSPTNTSSSFSFLKEFHVKSYVTPCFMNKRCMGFFVGNTYFSFLKVHLNFPFLL